MNVSEALLKISELTNQNLSLLQAINEAFYTKKSHILTEVAGTRFAIPSYLALENKINHLQDAFDNLVHAGQSGDAWMNYDGCSKHICIQGFQQAPNPVNLEPTQLFAAEDTFPFKDLLTPQPYMTFNLQNLPDNVTKVVVKKIIPYNENLIEKIEESVGHSNGLGLTEGQISYADVVAALNSGIAGAYIKGDDYIEYETIYNLPIVENTCDGNYIISEILNDKIDSNNLNEYITVRLDESTPCQYTKKDGVAKHDIPIGATLTNYDGACHLKVIDIQLSTRTMKLEVLHGSYVHLLPNVKGTDADKISDYSKLRFLSPDGEWGVNIDKELKVVLEEDRHVFIAVAPLNSTINVQSNWGVGVWVDTEKLRMPDGTSFSKYYNENVKNIGDALIEMTSISAPSITKYDQKLIQKLLALEPKLNNKGNETLQVVQINKHLNESETATNIRSLYNQKKQYEIDLTECQTKITNLSDELSKISFDDMSGTRSMYTAQISDLKAQQNELVASINKIIDSISLAANNAELPINSAKYHIRGYFPIEDILEEQGALDLLDQVVGIDVEYRYKNPDTPQANVSVIRDFLFTEWVPYNPPLRQKTMRYEGGKYIVKYEDINAEGSLRQTGNEQKFNQIDVPISQGEIVDIRARIIWAWGYPYTKLTSAWSKPTTITFPPEFVQDVTIKNIIEENNSDIETRRFENILESGGVSDHIDDALQDQDITYYHRPENIASGFYTEERRVIPLRDKLSEMSNALLEIKDLLVGTFAESVETSVVFDGAVTVLEPGIDNQIHLTPYSKVTSTDSASGSAFKIGDYACIMGVVKLTNKCNHTLRLFSLYPGSVDSPITSHPHILYKTNTSSSKVTLQSRNQWIYFTSQSRYNSDNKFYQNTKTGNKYDFSGDDNHLNACKNIAKILKNDLAGLSTLSDGLGWILYLPNEYDLCLSNDEEMCNITLAPSESLTVPIGVVYKLSDQETGNKRTSAKLTIGLDIRNSLYRDPVYYQFTINVKYNASLTDALTSQKQMVKSDTVKYNITTR